MAFDPKKFAEDILSGVKVDDTQKQVFLSMLAAPEVAKRLQEREDGYMRQSDYSRKQAEAQEALKKAEDWHRQLTVWQTNKEAELQTKLHEAAGHGTTIDETEQPGLTKKDVETMLATQLAAREKDELALVSVLQDIAFDHYKQFGEPIDTKGLIDRATKEGTNVKIAYERTIQPKLAEKASVAVEERVKRERAEAAQEALANANIPSMGAIQSLAGTYVHPTDGLKADRQAEFGWKSAAKHHTDAILSGKRIAGEDGF